MIFETVQTRGDADQRRVVGHVQRGAPRGALGGREVLKRPLRDAIRHADDSRGRDPIFARHQRRHTGAVRDDTMRGAACPTVRDAMRRAPVAGAPAAARDHGRHAGDARPRDSEDVAVDLLRVKYLDPLLREAPGETDALHESMWPVEMAQRHMNEPRACLFKAGA